MSKVASAAAAIRRINREWWNTETNTSQMAVFLVILVRCFCGSATTLNQCAATVKVTAVKQRFTKELAARLVPAADVIADCR